MQSSDPLALFDDSARVVAILVALLARQHGQLVEFFPDIGFQFAIGFFSIQTAMACPVIAIGFCGHREAEQLRSISFLFI